MKTQLIDNQKAFELENKIIETTKRVLDSRESKESLESLDKAIDDLHDFFKQYRASNRASL